MRAISSLDRVKNCWHHSVTADGSVGIRERQTDIGLRCSYVGLFTCGSGWSCPSCADKIMPRRAQEIIGLIDAHEAAGGRLMSLTFTLRHDRGHTLKQLWSTLSSAWGAASGGRKTSKRAMAGQVAGWVRNVEATWSPRNGWHLHVHVVALLEQDVDDLDADRVAGAMFNDWRDKTVDLGMPAPMTVGFKAVMVTAGEAAHELATYLAKGTYETAAWELAGGPRKRPAEGHHTPFMLLEQIVAAGGEVTSSVSQAIALWHEWEQVSKGKRAIVYAKGIRERYGLGAAATDEELAGDDRDVGRIPYAITRETWAAIRYTSAALLLAYLEDGDVDQLGDRLDRWLARRGLPAKLLGQKEQLPQILEAASSAAQAGAADFPRLRAP